MLMASHIRMGSCETIRSVHQTVAAIAVSLFGLSGLNAVSALDDICLEADWPRATVQLQKQTASIAENRPRLIATPQRCCRCCKKLGGSSMRMNEFDVLWQFWQTGGPPYEVSAVLKGHSTSGIR